MITSLFFLYLIISNLPIGFFKDVDASNMFSKLDISEKYAIERANR